MVLIDLFFQCCTRPRSWTPSAARPVVPQDFASAAFAGYIKKCFQSNLLLYSCWLKTLKISMGLFPGVAQGAKPIAPVVLWGRWALTKPWPPYWALVDPATSELLILPCMAFTFFTSAPALNSFSAQQRLLSGQPRLLWRASIASPGSLQPARGKITSLPSPRLAAKDWARIGGAGKLLPSQKSLSKLATANWRIFLLIELIFFKDKNLRIALIAVQRAF